METPPSGAPAPQSPPPAPPAPFPPAPPAGLPVVRVGAPRTGFGWRRILVLVGVILLIAGCAVLMLLTIGRRLGGTALVVGVVAAIVPVPLLVACFLWLDRYEPEPVKYLVFCFGWGAAVSTYGSYHVNGFAAETFHSAGLSDSLVAVLVAPFIEELTKALGPILLLLFRRREWSGVTDGIVYCGMSAIGFAMVENILYLGGLGYAEGASEYGPATGTMNVILIFISRVLVSGFAHPLFTAMTGVGLGIAARSADRTVRITAPLAGLLLAMILHGTWNLGPTLVQQTGQPLIMLYSYISLMVPIFLGMVGLAIWLRGWEGRLTERRLPDYVRAGWLTPPEVAALSSLSRRHAARQWARRVAGADGLRAMRGFQYAATRLALLRDGMVRGLDVKPAALARTVAEERSLLDTMRAARQVFVGRDPQTPAGVWDGSRYHLRFPDGLNRSVAAPEEPVVPIPVLLVPPRPMMANAGHGRYPSYPTPHHPVPPHPTPHHPPAPGYPVPPCPTPPGPYGGQPPAWSSPPSYPAGPGVAPPPGGGPVPPYGPGTPPGQP